MATAIQLRPSDLDALWNRSDPDLELDAQTGRIAAVRTEAPSSTRGLLDAARAAAPHAVGTAALVAREISRWD